MSAEFDIAICGGGPVGQSLALMLVQRGMPASRIALLDAKTDAQAQADARTIALSYGSTQIFNKMGVWPFPATAIQEIHVSRRGHFGRTLMHSRDYALPALGYVARYGDIVAPLAAALQTAGVQVRRPVTVVRLEELDQHVVLHQQDGGTLNAKIVVQAEGGTFDGQSARPRRHDYQQTAVIAHLRCDAAIAHRAFERFTEDGPLALLPQNDGYALVWCVHPDKAADLLKLSDTAFLHALQTAFGHRLGKFVSISQRHSFPLGLNAHEQCSARTVSIGNAAQTLHPVAGQGLNLGLRDATVLARLLAQQTLTDSLKEFIRLSKADRRSTVTLTDTMARIFASSADGSWRQSLLALGLGVLDLVPAARHPIAQHMLFGRRA
jgi:2-octaprenyl-6-methoxyphenol hydroxylase